ncbi:MAG: methylmalonyl Co-A mutase-associated GTPase MeaB [Bacteroidales bacterium]|nr:methylmalonyl Co-A mutase-associated GTPase MeaB [Bacteroidales bacterium]
MKKHPQKSAMKVNKGIEHPPSINPNLTGSALIRRKPVLPAVSYFEGIRNGDRSILSQAITLIESQLPKDQQIAQEINALCLPFAGNSIRIGITGVPGVGKSSFIESIGGLLTKAGKKLAILAIDPSSERSKGSILGDKTRMETLANDINAFIRPSPAAGTLGGVARKTREIMIVCEAAGFDTIFIETVGVGQSEIAVHSMVDFFLLLMLAGAGDELQGIKRGIMEMADLIAITKADGDNIHASERARNEYQNALHLFPPSESGWTPDVLTFSSKEKTGIDQLWNNISEYFQFVKQNNYFQNRRKEQLKAWMNETIREGLERNFYAHPDVKTKLAEYEKQLSNGQVSPYAAAQQLLNKYLKVK